MIEEENDMTITKESLEYDIKEIKNQIKFYEDYIVKLNEKLIEKKELLSDLKKYEKSPVAEKTLYKYISDKTKSVPLMDEFESLTDEGFRKYERIVIKNTIWGQSGRYHLILARMSASEYVGDITMTDFKIQRGNYGLLIKHVESEVSKAKEKAILAKDDEIIFETPFLLRAQNSSNRTGYGNEYNGYDLVYEGTLYGETTKYAFIGVIIE